MDLMEVINEYYDGRGLSYPDAWEALGFATTELGEVYEILLAKNNKWIRNNPQNKPQEFSKDEFATELGDVIMMIMVAGYVEGVNPIQALKDKINRKLEKINAERAVQEDAEKAEEQAAKEYWETYTDAKADDEYDYVQDDLNFDASRERQHR